MSVWQKIYVSFGLFAVSWMVLDGQTFAQSTSTSKPQRANQPVTRPNILILYADDLGYGDLGIQNSESRIPTPNLDQLARRGMRFTDGHSSSGVCTPSRYAMLTGRYHWRDFHGIVDVFGKSVFQADRLTLPMMLQQQGYHTACIGKWHLGWDWEAIKNPQSPPLQSTNGKKAVFGPDAFEWDQPIPGGPLERGFDYYFGDDVINFPPYAWIENDKFVTAPNAEFDTRQWKKIKEGNWECRPGPMCADWDPYQVLPTLARKGVEFIQAQSGKDQPFCLYFALPSPHAPIIPNDEWDGKSQAGAYGDFVCQTDAICGQLLHALEDSGQSENTIVIFTADNGSEHYAYQRDAKFGHWSSNPFRGAKRDLYEGGHHVPFVIRWPGLTPAGSVSNALVSQIDLFATLAVFFQVTLPDNAAEDSHNLLPVLTGESAPVRTHHVHNTGPDRYALRSGDWILINTENGYQNPINIAWEKRHQYPAADDQPTELYDWTHDVEQRHNVAAKHPDKVVELQTLLTTIRSQQHTAPRLAK